MRFAALALSVIQLAVQGGAPLLAQDARQWIREASEVEHADPGKAERLATQAIEQDAALAAAYYYRGRARFRLAKFAASVEDFDRYVKLQPAASSRQWERGIACYYAGKFQAGAEQFALYQTYHDNDVENSVWRFLCMAPIPDQGFERARAAMLPIRDDRRVPMMQVYDLFAGKLQVQDVLKAVDRGEVDAPTRSGRLFYARLYIGLFFEAKGNDAEARRYLQLAAEKHRDDADKGRVNSFMWAVADVHWKRMRAAANSDTDSPQPKPD